MNQSTALGSNVTFNCTVTGYPKPTIAWTKGNDSHSIESNVRVKIMTDDDKSWSQLVISAVTREDYGKYQCVANNSAGVTKSRVVFLNPGALGTHIEYIVEFYVRICNILLINNLAAIRAFEALNQNIT